MTIYLAADHAGYSLKEVIKAYLEKLGYGYEDLGTDSDQACDYPDFIFPVAVNVSKDPEKNKGIILGGSGQGEAMTANRIEGIRATTYYHHDLDIIKLSRTHNNANILSIGARFISEDEAKEAIKLWLETEFPGDERHVRRISKMDEK